MLSNRFKIKIRMESDWQIGTGTGIPGGVDKLISKDLEGFPQIPAKSIVGIWRDALETLCEGMGGDWPNWVEVIFGSQPNVDKIPHYKPVPATLSTQPARIPEALRRLFGSDQRIKQALTFVKVGVKIDKETETSEDNALRFEEMGRVGTVLETFVDLDRNDEITSALLILSSKLIDRIGGKRRRGAGKCKFEIEKIGEIEIAAAVEAIEKHHKTTNGKILSRTKPEAILLEFGNGHSDWQTCEYTLSLQTPVSIVSAVLGNVSETTDFVPGTYLIPLFTKHFGQNIFELIQNGDFQISPATVSIGGERGYPVPKIFAREKMDSGKSYNRLNDCLEKTTPQTKPVRSGYVSGLGGTLEIGLAETPLTLMMHNAVEDEYQRPTSEVVGLYSRKAIKAGTVLKGEIRFRNASIDFQSLTASFAGQARIRIGTSKKDDYGLALITFGKTQPLNPKSAYEGRRLAVYLASDIILRNSNLRQTNLVSDLINELSSKIGVNLKLADVEMTLISSAVHARRIESWQVGWGLPRPSLSVMAAGSVVVLEANSEIDHKRLIEIEAEGIGERRGEGYGSIVFNPPILNVSKPTFKNAHPDDVSSEYADTAVEDIEFAKIIEETAWRQELQFAVSRVADKETSRPRSEQIFGFDGLTMSQIGGLRAVIMQMRSQADRKIVMGWLRHLEATRNRLDKWKGWRIEKIKRVLHEEDVWALLGDDFNPPPLVVPGRQIGEVKKLLWAEAVKSLFYACQHSIKRNLEKRHKAEEAQNV